MGKYVKYTFEQLTAAHKSQANALRNARQDFKNENKKYRDLKSHIAKYAFIHQKPDYFFSFSGNFIFNKYLLKTGLPLWQLTFIILVGYIDPVTTDKKLFFGKTLSYADKRLETLRQIGYLLSVNIPGKSKKRPRKAWTLTQKGRDIETGYKAYYDTMMDKIRSGQFEPMDFALGYYYKVI